MSLFLFLLVLQAIVAAALVGIILMQRNEGGGLGIGGSPSGMMSARGAADFLTRATRWLAIVFVVLSIVLAAIAAKTSGSGVSVESTLERTGPVKTAPNPAAPAPAATPAPADDPLADLTK